MRLPYTYRYDEVDENTMYIGKAAAGSSESEPVWRVAKYTKVDTVSQLTYAGGVTGWNARWTDRTTLTYI